MGRKTTAKGKQLASPDHELSSSRRTLSAVDVAYQAIKSDILNNRLKPGEAVPVEKYVKDLSLSRTPVREATLRLERERLVEIRPRLGTFVSHLDLRDIRDMYAVRRLLEGEAAGVTKTVQHPHPWTYCFRQPKPVFSLVQISSGLLTPLEIHFITNPAFLDIDSFRDFPRQGTDENR